MLQANNPLLLTALAKGKIAIQGKFLWGSNHTFLAEVVHEGAAIKAVYKPTRGERPLWDFPAASLSHRETAAYLVSEALGWGLVPETVYRRRGPLGAGSLQRFIEHDPEYHYFNFSVEDRTRLRPVVAFDLLINNADRKGGHLLVDAAQRIWLIDHGVCFHVEDKLRTVLWDFGGEAIPAALLDDLARLALALRNPTSAEVAVLTPHLRRSEIKHLARRAEALVTAPVFPLPDTTRRPYPWPPL